MFHLKQLQKTSKRDVRGRDSDTLTRHLRADVKEARGCLQSLHCPAEGIQSSFCTVSPETAYRYHNR